MGKKDLFTKVLAIGGIFLAWFPILAPILFSVAGMARDRQFHFDYLMPAEFFLVAFASSGLLLWAALRLRSQRRLIGWSLAIAVGMPVGGQALAMLPGQPQIWLSQPAGGWCSSWGPFSSIPWL